MSNRDFAVLLVEDDEDDVELIRRGLKAGKLAVHLDVVYDGNEALAFLRRMGRYAHAGIPDLVLLDLNLPKKDGREVLKEVKGDETLKAIPVVVLTTSQDQIEILKSYRLGANCFVTKPMDFNQFVHVVQSIETFWFTVVKLPGCRR
ncbi:MAG: response regulator [Elusimicrobia bacterium]|nr:response regulator [Elusimicrobiota bacterium]